MNVVVCSLSEGGGGAVSPSSTSWVPPAPVALGLLEAQSLPSSNAARRLAASSNGGLHQAAFCANDDRNPPRRARAVGPTRPTWTSRGGDANRDVCERHGDGAECRADSGAATYVGVAASLKGDAMAVHVDRDDPRRPLQTPFSYHSRSTSRLSRPLFSGLNSLSTRILASRISNWCTSFPELFAPRRGSLFQPFTFDGPAAAHPCCPGPLITPC